MAEGDFSVRCGHRPQHLPSLIEGGGKTAGFDEGSGSGFRQDFLSLPDNGGSKPPPYKIGVDFYAIFRAIRPYNAAVDVYVNLRDDEGIVPYKFCEILCVWL